MAFADVFYFILNFGTKTLIFYNFSLLFYFIYTYIHFKLVQSVGNLVEETLKIFNRILNIKREF